MTTLRFLPPSHHASDPASSILAAERITDSGKRATHTEMVLRAPVARPGATAGELGADTGLGAVEARRRLYDLRMTHLAYQGTRRPCSVEHTSQCAWFAVEAQGGFGW